MPHVLIIGGSYGGLSAAHALLKSKIGVKVTMVNPTEHFYFNVAAPRILANSGAFDTKQYWLPIKDGYIGYGDAFKFVLGRAVSVESSSAVVNTSAGEETIEYDYLIIASGTTSPSVLGKSGLTLPLKSTDSDDLPQTIANAQKLIQGATSIVIGGGGTTGVELAGEIAENHPTKSITLVSGSARVLPDMLESTSSAAKRILERLNVRVLVGTRVVGHDDETVTLSNGETLPAEVYLDATGIIPNSSFLPNNILDAKGFVLTDETLKVKNTTNMYALGDVTAFKQKLANKARDQARVIVKNIDAELRHTTPKAKYDEGAFKAIVVIGTRSGTGVMFGRTLWSSMVRQFKGKTYNMHKAKSVVIQ